MPPDELDLQPLEGMARWLGPTLERLVFRALSMEEQARGAQRGLLHSQEAFFRRDRHAHPEIDGEAWRLELTGFAAARTFSLGDLRALPQRAVACVAECAGNGNHLMGSAGLMGQAVWEGPTATGVIEACGGAGAATHLCFRGADTLGPRGGYHYGLSIEELERSGAIVALTHGGEPLSRARGFPARLVVPGVYAMSYVKWLTRIEGLIERHRGFYNDVLYNNRRRVDGRWIKEQARWISLKSVLTRCVRVEGGWELYGWAWGGGEPIAKVEVTVDGGKTWQEARLRTVGDVLDTEQVDARRAWTEFCWRWSDPAPGAYLLTSRAFDATGRMQPEREPPDVRGHYDQVRWKWRRVVVPVD